ncbi:MAG: CoA-binding protein [Leptospirales bacterium]
MPNGDYYIQMDSLLELLRHQPVIGLVGATNSTTKYGNIIYRDLLRKGFQVLPINPRAETVDGYPAYKGLSEANAHTAIDLLVYVIPPKYTQKSLEQALALNLKRVWIQPGAGDAEVRSYLEENGFEYVIDDCVMVKT